MSKFIVTIDQKLAIAAGNNQTGSYLIDVDVSSLPQPVLDVLAGNTQSYNSTLQDKHGDYRIILSLPAATPEAVIEWAQHEAAKNAAAAEQQRIDIEAIIGRFSAMSVEEIAADWSDGYNRPVAKYPERDSAMQDAIANPRIADKIIAARQMYKSAQEEKSRVQAEREAAAKQARELAEQARAEKRVERDKRRASQISAWVSEHGTPNQQARHNRNMLPESEVLDAMRNEAFSALGEIPRYQRITDDEMRAECGDEYDSGCEYSANTITELTAEQFDLLTKIESSIPRAVVEFREHVGYLVGRDEADDPDVRRISAHVTVNVGEFEFTREFAA